MNNGAINEGALAQWQALLLQITVDDRKDRRCELMLLPQMLEVHDRGGFGDRRAQRQACELAHGRLCSEGLAYFSTFGDVFGESAADFYDGAFLDQASLAHPRFRWHRVLSAQARMQQAALTHAHRWADTQDYACGNSAMISQARELCLAAGVQAHRFVAEAFVASGASLPTASIFEAIFV